MTAPDIDELDSSTDTLESIESQSRNIGRVQKPEERKTVEGKKKNNFLLQLDKKGIISEMLP